MCRLSFKSVFLLKYTFCHFYTGWYINKYTLHMYCYSKLFKKVFFKLSLLWYQTCHDYLMICSKNNNLYLNLKGIMQKLHLIWRFFLDMIIFLHINTPWIKQYCYICSSQFSTNLVILVQATIGRYYMCKVWKLSNV